VITLKTSSDFGLDYQAFCENNKKCILDVVSVTDPVSNNKQKVQVFISGQMHGDEEYGPHIALYLIELLASNYKVDNYITGLL